MTESKAIKVGDKLTVHLDAQLGRVEMTIVVMSPRAIGYHVFAKIHPTCGGPGFRIVQGMDGEWYYYSQH